MATLTNTKIKDTYDGLLKTTDNDIIGATKKVITDGLGNASVLSIGTASASFSSDIEVNTLTIGLGSGSIATNTAIGLDALFSNTSGSGNVSVGQGSMRSNTVGLGNVSVGKDALRLNTTGNYNVAVGYVALYNNIDGADNVAIGYSSLNANTSGSQNIAIGRQALLSNTTGGSNTAIGYSSLVGNITGVNNTAVGRSSLYANTASYNTAVGAYALLDNTTGTNNTAVGYLSLSENTTGGYNTAVGSLTLEDNTTGSRNTAVGFNALDSNTEGSDNTAIGHNALDGNTTGVKNTAVGRDALLQVSTGFQNTALGFEAANDVTTGSNNVHIGYQATASSATVSNEIVIGSGATGNGSNTATYGNASITGHHFTAGQVNVSGNLAVDTNTLYVDAANNRVGIGTSSPAAGSLLDVNGDIKLAAGAKIKFNDDRYFSPENNVDGAEISANGIFKVKTGATPEERFRIDSSGNVGIGASPSSKLTVFEAGASGIATVDISGGASGAGSLQISAGKVLGTTSFDLIQNSSGAYVYQRDSNPLIFGTANTERMRITSGGYLKASNTGSYYLPSSSFHELITNQADVITYLNNTHATNPYGFYMLFTNANPNNTTNYFIRCSSTGGVSRFFVYSNGNVVNTNGSYGAISDVKLKENIVDASPKLDDLMQVKVRNYNLIGEDKKQLGVVAQELEEVFPSMIDESPDFEEQEVIDEEGNVTKERVDLGTTTKSVKYSVFVPMLIKAMQEQQEIINDLKARIETLEAK